MKRVMVIGVSSGVGKSTFARRLGELTNIDVTHLDSLYWKPGWVETSTEDFAAAQQKIVRKDSWIIEGNYTGTIGIREPLADTIIYLELPLPVCLYRVLRRRIEYNGKTRFDMGEGCEEKLDWPFLKFILMTYRKRKKNMKKRLQRYKNEGKAVYCLKSSKQIDDFLADRKN